MTDTKISRDWFIDIERKTGPLVACLVFVLDHKGEVTAYGSGLAASNSVKFQDALTGVLDDLRTIQSMKDEPPDLE